MERREAYGLECEIGVLMGRKEIKAVDLFCGAGGSSTGLAQACAAQDKSLKLFALNHWSVAIDTHSLNHPDATHLCESIDNVDPRKAVPWGRLDILIASPECTHHSRARGGKPVNDQSRASAWNILRWAEALYIDNILIENVREFEQWGPIGANGCPLKSKIGETFKAFIASLHSLGYNVEWKVLNAANYGDATTRERLFIMARRGGKKIVWPVPTHTRNGADTLFGETKKWRPAREIIDWSIEGKSIFRRKKPLADTTMQRIMAGLERFGGKDMKPFIVALRNTTMVRTVDQPLHTITAGGNHLALCEPFVLGQQSCSAPRSVDDPIPTVATKGAIALVEPFIVPFFGERAGQDPRVHDINQPLPTVTGQGAGALVQPFIIPLNHGKDDTRTHSVEKPMPTITSFDAWGVVQPFVVPIDHTGSKSVPARSAESPLPTVTAKERLALVEPYLVRFNKGYDAVSIDAPVPGITTKDKFGLAEPFVMAYYGNGENVTSVEQPLPTATARDRFALVEPDRYALDIRFRMLQPHELAGAMSFPSDYQFTGSREDRVKQIGNAVGVRMSQALCSSLIG